MIGFMRDGQRFQLEPGAFLEWARAGNLRPTDYVQGSDGQLRLASTYTDLAAYLPKQQQPSLLEGVLKAGLAIGGVWLTLQIADELLRPKPLRQRSTRLRQRNSERVEEWKRQHVYLRDGGRCVYCGATIAYGRIHVDHSVSRANGGTNHLNNLRTACGGCNLAKGGRNARQFVR